MNFNLAEIDDVLELNYTLEILKQKKAKIELKIKKKDTRSQRQNKARWLYLSHIAIILNEGGHTFEPVGMTIDVPFTKDNLYAIYWQSLRLNMYPNKKMQLDTKEFSLLVEMVQMMFAKIFEITIPFPSLENKLDEKM